MLVGNDDNATNEATHKITIRKRKFQSRGYLTGLLSGGERYTI